MASRMVDVNQLDNVLVTSGYNDGGDALVMHGEMTTDNGSDTVLWNTDLIETLRMTPWEGLCWMVWR